jgi:VCBS repeat-containing protein
VPDTIVDFVTGSDGDVVAIDLGGAGLQNFTSGQNPFATQHLRLIARDVDGDGAADDTVLQGDRDGPTTAINGWIDVLFFLNVLPTGFVSTNFSPTYVLTTGNPPPLAEPDAFQVDEDGVLNAFAPGVIGNDSDPNGDAFTVQVVSGVSHGTLVLNADGSFVYTPFANYSGTDQFTYRGNDGVSLGNVATVTITVNPENDAPTAFNNAYVVQQGQVLTVNAATGVLTNDNDPDGDALAAALVVGPANGALTLAANGSFVYTPNAGYFGPDQFTYRANDGAFDSNIATVTITVQGSNTAPVGVADSYNATEDTALVISSPALGVLANDTDAQGDALTAALVSSSGGTVTLNPNGTFTFTPSANFQGTGGFSYRPNDGQALGNVTSVQIVVANVNDAPVAVNNVYSVAEDAVLTVAVGQGVLANDTDVDPSEVLTAILAAGPTNGTLALNANGSFTYTPNANFTGQDSFTYRANDGEVDSTLATVTITVTPENDAPVATTDSYAVDEDGLLTVSAANGVLANDTDADGNPLTAQLVSGPGNGSFVLNANGSFEYIPSPNFNGQVSFTYRASDGLALSAATTVTITVGAANDAPVAIGNGYVLDEDTALVIAAPGVLANDSDADGDALTALLVTGPANGTLALNTDGSFTYTPNANYFGGDSFTYRASDGALTSAAFTVSLSVNAVNDAPVATDDAVNAAFQTPLAIPVATLLGNDADVDNPVLTITGVGGAVNGTVSLVAGVVTFTPNAGFSGAAGFTYTVSDGALTDTGAVAVTVAPPGNTPPFAAADAFSGAEDTQLAGNVLDNDVDADGNALTATLATGPANGVLVLNANGSFTYTPAANFNGADSFTYRVNDGTVNGNTAAVALSVTPVNDAPLLAGDANFTTSEDMPFAGNLLDLLGATDIDGDDLDIVSVSGDPLGAFLFDAETGVFTFTPDANENGSSSVTVTVTDGTVQVAATLGFAVAAVNDAPVAGDDAQGTALNIPLVVQAAALLANDSDIDGGALAITAVSNATNGTVSLAGGVVTFTPTTGFIGLGSFVYTLSDGAGGTDTATVTVGITAGDPPPNTPPVGVADAFGDDEDAAITGNVLGNDTDADAGQVLSAVLVAGPAHGTLALNPNGSFTYTPDANFKGGDSFTYRPNDGIANGNVTTVTLTVAPLNDAPSATDDAYAVQEGRTLTIDAAVGLLANDSDIDGDAITVVAVESAANGTIDVFADGSFVYTPDAGFEGTDTVIYTISDGVLTGTAKVGFIVGGPGNVAPVAVDDVLSTRPSEPVLIDVQALVSNDTDADGDRLSFDALVTGVTNGTLVGDAFGNYTYTPNAGFVGQDQFTYQVVDGAGGTDIGTVTINVVNAAPVAGGDAVTTRPGQVLDIAALDLLANDSDADGDTLTIDLLVDTTGNGLLLITDDGFTYTPNAGFVGQDQFTYRVADGFGGTDTATVTIDVVNAVPVAVDDTVTYHGRSFTFLAASLLANDTDADGDTLDFETIIGPLNGTLVSDPTNTTLTYTPPDNFFGSETFTYTVKDGFGGFDTATVTMTLVNEAPDAVDDILSTAFNTAVQIRSAQVLANDTDADGDALVVTGAGAAANGNVTFVSGLGLFYQPNAGFVGLDTFTYTINDGLGGSDTATVSVIVGAAPVPTTAFQISQGGTGNPLGSIPSGPPLSPAQLALIETAPTLINGQPFTRLENEDTWNGFKNAAFGPGEYDPLFGENILFANFVDNRIDLSDATGVDLDVIIVGGKRGLLKTADGDDAATWYFHSNEGTWSNLATIDTGTGNDTIFVSSINLTTLDNTLLADNAVPNNGSFWNANYDGRFSVARVEAGEGNDTITAAGRSRLEAFGGSGNDTITGALGNDLIAGGNDNDVLFGGAGADRFRFDNTDGSDVITDFSVAQGDKVQLSSGGNCTLAGTSFTYGTTTVTADNGHIWTAADFLFV